MDFYNLGLIVIALATIPVHNNSNNNNNIILNKLIVKC